MKHPLRRLGPILLTAGLLAGCVTTSTLDQIRAGMSPAEVQAILGPPEAVAHAPGRECTYYTVLKDFWNRTPWTLSNRYYVCYDDGKVQSFGRADTPPSG